jgi:heat-inducible transcriptional repressor
VSSSQLINCVPLAGSTLRKELQELERNNFLSKVHISSGRIPSNKALKLYVNDIFNSESLQGGPGSGLPTAIDLDLNEISQTMLSRLSFKTQNPGFILLSSLMDFKFRQIRFVKVSVYKILAVIKTENNWNYTKAFYTGRNYSESELKVWGSILNKEFANSSISTALKKIRNRIYVEKARYLTMYQGLYGLLKSKEFLSTELFFKGEEYIFNLGMKNTRRMKELLVLIEQKERFSQFIDDFLKKNGCKAGPSVIFGAESGISAFENLILVFSCIYSRNRSRVGNVGIIGPRYMKYASNVFEINQMSKYFSTTVSNQ